MIFTTFVAIFLCANIAESRNKSSSRNIFDKSQDDVKKLTDYIRNQLFGPNGTYPTVEIVNGTEMIIRNVLSYQPVSLKITFADKRVQTCETAVLMSWLDPYSQKLVRNNCPAHKSGDLYRVLTYKLSGYDKNAEIMPVENRDVRDATKTAIDELSRMRLCFDVNSVDKVNLAVFNTDSWEGTQMFLDLTICGWVNPGNPNYKSLNATLPHDCSIPDNIYFCTLSVDAENRQRPYYWRLGIMYCPGCDADGWV